MVVNVGSLNIDVVFPVPAIARPGETVAARGARRFAGGKGLNQSLALARAGAAVCHAGCVGRDGGWLRDMLAAAGVDCRYVAVDDTVGSGAAFIQVDAAGENAIVIDAGANGRVSAAALAALFDSCGANDYLLLQNEVSDIPGLIRAGRRRGMTVVFNPSPCGGEVRRYPLADVDMLIVNQTEAMQLGQGADAETALAAILRDFPGMRVVLTLGARGAIYAAGGGRLAVPAVPARVVDTTAAGDTFTGYLLAGLSAGVAVEGAMRLAAAAAALTVSRHGAADAIPRRAEAEAELAAAMAR